MHGLLLPIHRPSWFRWKQENCPSPDVLLEV